MSSGQRLNSQPVNISAVLKIDPWQKRISESTSTAVQENLLLEKFVGDECIDPPIRFLPFANETFGHGCAVDVRQFGA